MMKVNWGQVGRVTEPGRYMFRFGFVVITTDDLAIWQQFPDATFALVPMMSAKPDDEYKLGVFDVSGAK
jgi:hypothetical protein